jgi:integrase
MRVIQRCAKCRRYKKPKSVCKCGRKLVKTDDWWVEYKFDGKTKRELIGPDAKDLAEIRLGVIRKEIIEKRFINVNKNATMTLGKVVEWYLNLPEVMGLRSYRSRSNSLISYAARLGVSKTIVSLSTDDINIARKTRDSALPATHNRELSYLKACLNMAVRYGKIESNPIANVKLLEEDNHRDVRFTISDLSSFTPICDDNIRNVVTVAFFTMMRQNEIVGLTWSEVDLDNWVIRLPKRRTKGKRDRTLPIVPEVRHIFTREGVNFGLERVFKNCQYSDTYLSKLFSKAVKRSSHVNLTFHDLRHASAQWFYEKGYGIREIMKWGGWEDFSTLKRYLMDYTDESVIRFKTG